MSLWQKCLHRSLSNSIQHQQREEDWEVNLRASIVLVMSVIYSSVVTLIILTERSKTGRVGGWCRREKEGVGRSYCWRIQKTRTIIYGS